MNQASQYLLGLAKQNIQAYLANPEAKAAMVTGSTATEQADFYSDVEMFIYYARLPSIEKLQFARKQNGGSEPIRIFDGYSEGFFGEFYFIDGVQFHFSVQTHETVHRKDEYCSRKLIYAPGKYLSSRTVICC